MKLLGIISVGLDTTDQLLLRLSAFVSYWKKWDQIETVPQLFIDFKEASDSVKKEVLYNILIEVRIPMKLVRMIKMCLYETYIRIHTGKHCSDSFPIHMF
jgi:hypothetical protein